MLWHSRPEAVCAIDRDLIWQIYRRPNQGCGSGRRQHHPTRAWIDKVQESGSELLKMIVDDSEAPEDERWDFEGLSEEDNLCIGAQEKNPKTLSTAAPLLGLAALAVPLTRGRL